MTYNSSENSLIHEDFSEHINMLNTEHSIIRHRICTLNTVTSNMRGEQCGPGVLPAERSNTRYILLVVSRFVQPSITKSNKLIGTITSHVVGILASNWSGNMKLASHWLVSHPIDPSQYVHYYREKPQIWTIQVLWHPCSTLTNQRPGRGSRDTH